MDDETVIKTLTQIKGVGRWTAEMYLMFSMNRPDVFPIDDVALRNAMSDIYEIPKENFDDQARIIAEKWRPYRTIACWYLYKYLDNSRIGNQRIQWPDPIRIPLFKLELPEFQSHSADDYMSKRKNNREGWNTPETILCFFNNLESVALYNIREPE